MKCPYCGNNDTKVLDSRESTQSNTRSKQYTSTKRTTSSTRNSASARQVTYNNERGKRNR